MSNGFIIRPLSGSVGGAPILLDSTTPPGTLIHKNPEDSGGNDVIQNVLIGNPNPNQVTLLVQTTGPGITTPRVIRIDVPPTAEGTDVRLFYTPFLLAPGFSYNIMVVVQPGNEWPYLYGYVERYAAGGFTGYGGLISSTPQALADLTAGTWVKLPFQTGGVAVPKNVIQDPAKNSLAVGVPGVWAASAYVTLQFTKNSGSDRVLYLRFWNDTKGVEVSDSPFPLYVEQGSTGGSWSVPTVPNDVPQDIVGDEIVMEIGGSADAFTGLQLDKAGLNFYLLDPAL